VISLAGIRKTKITIKIKGEMLMHSTFSSLKGFARNTAVAASAIGLVLSTALPAFAVPTDASVSLGDPRVDATSTYTVDLSTVDTGTAIGCFEVNFSTAFDGSDTVSNLDTSSSTLDSQALLGSGFAVDNTQSASNIVRATNATPATPSATGTVVFGSITNGDIADTSYFATITTYATDTCSTEVESVIVKFVYTNGQEVSVTVEPTLNFNLTGVSSSTAAADSENTSVTTTDGTIPFGAVTTASNGIAAHDLSISTNAQAGYNVHVRYSGALNNGLGDTITDVSGDGVTFPAAGNEAFGYNVVGGASDWQQFSASNEVVITSAAATTGGGDTAQVTYQVGIGSDTEAGTYTSTVIYTATPTY